MYVCMYVCLYVGYVGLYVGPMYTCMHISVYVVKENKKEVEYMLFNCKNKKIISISEHFEERYCRYVKNVKTTPVSSKIREILNAMPTCHDLIKDNANSLICTFVKSMYVTLKKINV